MKEEVPAALGGQKIRLPHGPGVAPPRGAAELQPEEPGTDWWNADPPAQVIDLPPGSTW